MSIKITRSSSELHPEGMFPFCVKSMEESKGKFGTQIKWVMESKERRDDGEKFAMIYYTGTVLSNHPDCKLTKLVDVLGLDEEEFENDTDSAIGLTFAGKVEHDEEGKYSNIVKVFHKDKLKSKAKDAAEGRRKKSEDPFEDE